MLIGWRSTHLSPAEATTLRLSLERSSRAAFIAADRDEPPADTALWWRELGARLLRFARVVAREERE